MSVYAQEYGYFFNSNNSDRKYNADSFETWLKPFFVSGVFQGGLQVKAQSDPDMTVQVTPGYANLNGKPAHWPDTNNLTIATASGVYDRIDTIVLRRDNTNRAISIEVVTGTASASPQPVAPVRTSDIFELVSRKSGWASVLRKSREQRSRTHGRTATSADMSRRQSKKWTSGSSKRSLTPGPQT